MKTPLALGVPRGGVVTAAVLARELNAELDIVLSRKLRVQPELAFGAIGEDGEVYQNPDIYVDGLTREYIEGERKTQLEKLQRRAKLFRAVRPQAPVTGRSVIITDDGIATTATIKAALHSLRAKNPHELIVPVPVGSLERIEELRLHFGRVVYLEAPESFYAVGQFYDDIREIHDEEVLDILRDCSLLRFFFATELLKIKFSSCTSLYSCGGSIGEIFPSASPPLRQFIKCLR